MGTTSPEQLRAEIEETRAKLDKDLDRLADRVSPRAMAGRQGHRMRDAATGLRERVMGGATEGAGKTKDRTRQTAESMRETAGQAAGQAGQAAGQVGDAARKAPEQMTRQTQGNPLAAGLVAFGAGMLAASLFPETQAEERAAAQLTDRAGELAGPVKETARESAQRLKDDAQQTAKDAVREVKERTRHEAGARPDGGSPAHG